MKQYRLTKKIVDLLKESRDETGATLNYLVPKPIAKKMVSYMLIREDLLHAQNALLRLISLKQKGIAGGGWDLDETIEESMWFSAIIHYCECFNSNKGGYSVLSEKDIRNDELDFHLKIIAIRNSYIAHRDDTESEQALVIMQIPKTGELGDKIKFISKSLRDISHSLEELEAFSLLVVSMIAITNEKSQKEIDRTSEAFFKNYTEDEIKSCRIENIDFDVLYSVL